MVSPRHLQLKPPAAARIHSLRRHAYAAFAFERVHQAATGRVSHSSNNINSESDLVPLQTKPVQDAPHSLASSSAAFLDYIRSATPTPLIFRAAGQSRESSPTRGRGLLETLRAAGDRIVEVEAGRDVHVDGHLRISHDHRVPVPLHMYLDWLCDGTPEFPPAPWYLAQWYAQEEVPGVREAVRVPALLAPLLEDGKADMYRCGFFVGPPTAMTPLHRDPYCNLYTLNASSDASVHAKHWLLLPPSLERLLAPPSNAYMQPNMSPLDCSLRRRRDEVGGFDVLINRTSVPEQTAQDVLDANVALSCIMREGDMLFVPRRWWHRVENVVLQGEDTERLQSGRHPGWTAGVGWWFLPRTT